MAKKKKNKTTVQAPWSGVDVDIYDSATIPERRGDVAPIGEKVDSAKVKDNGELSVELSPGTYTAVAEVEHNQPSTFHVPDEETTRFAYLDLVVR